MSASSPDSDKLTRSFLAAIMCGLSSVSTPERRCLIFTIHLPSAAQHSQLCQGLHHAAEAHIEGLGRKKRSPTWSGLGSFIDRKGSRYTGADLDTRKVHCHGLIVVPHFMIGERLTELATVLHDAALGVLKQGSPQDASIFSAIQVQPFQPRGEGSRTPLEDWVSYASKYERQSPDQHLGYFLPPSTGEMRSARVSNAI